MQNPLIIAHRGDQSRAPENTLEAFQLALSIPVDMIEFDLRMSKDNVLYALHDRNTGRTGDRNVDVEGSLSHEISLVRLGNKEPLPTIDDVLKLVAGKTGLNIEIKSDGAGGVLSDHLRRIRYTGPITVSSFKEDELRALRKANRSMPVAAIYDTFSVRHVDDYKRKGYDIVSLRKNTVSEHLVRACQAAGVRIYVWTVNDEEEMKRCIEWKVNGIYTDNPGLLKQIIEKSAARNVK